MLVPVVVIVLVVVVVAAVLVAVRRPRQDEGMDRFRRHIDALSPESRRVMKERAWERTHERNRGRDGDPGTGAGPG